MYKITFHLSSTLRILALCGVLFTSSCTDLTEQIYSEVPASEFYQTEEQFISALGAAYTVLGDGGLGTHVSMLTVEEVASDELVIPQRGQDWFDGGVWLRLHRHTWRYDEPYFNNMWNFLYEGVNATNRLIYQFEKAIDAGNADPELAASFIAELEVLRALYYYWLLDNFGNVPIVKSFTDAPENPSQPSQDFQDGRKAVFDFVESSILANIDKLNEDVGSTYGRINKWVAHLILAKLYLNAEVYTGQPRWQDVVVQTNAIINSGAYSLTSNYAANFITENQGSPEIIFSVPYDRVFMTGFNMHLATLHYANQITFQLQVQPWNGYSTLEAFYTSYIDPSQNPGPQDKVWGTEPTSTSVGLELVQGTIDDRLTNFIVGPQFAPSGERIIDLGAGAEDPNGPPVTLTPEINELEPNAIRQAGVRVGKYEIAAGTGNSLDNDLVVFRYADVLMMKAEALWRQNAGSGEALGLVNRIRERAGVAPFPSLSADKILAERGREFFFEGLRRQDLIRFDGVEGGKTRFNDPWWEKGISEPWRNVFPIPRDQLQANSNLIQNPGYIG